jgi:beta-N-acetylhexosaminidase
MMNFARLMLKILAAGLTVLFVLTLAACFHAGGGNDSGANPPAEQTPAPGSGDGAGDGGAADGGVAENPADGDAADQPADDGEVPSDEPQQPPANGSDDDELAERVRSMDVREKIGQMVMVGIEGYEINEQTRQLIEQHRAGGVILFGRNVSDAVQTLKLLNDLKEANQQVSRIPLLLGVDEEGGKVSRLPKEFIPAPSARDVGRTDDPSLAYRIGQTTAGALRALGWNVDFAPVLDVDSNPDNPVIGDRSYADNADAVAAMGVEMMRGLQAEHVIPVVKHFPGHGDTSVDSHVDLPVVPHAEERLRRVELAPFAEAVRQGADAVMVGHLLVPAFDESVPASMSSTLIGGLLRDELGFDGVVFTDDMTMGAITSQYGIGEAAVKAVQAGADIVMIAHGYDQQIAAIRALEQAAESGAIAPERLDESVMRILRLKRKYALSDERIDSLDTKRWKDRMLDLLEEIK